MRIFPRTGLALVISLVGFSSAIAQNQSSDAHAVLLEWVRAEKLTAEEAAQWREDRVMLQSMIEVLRRESEQLKEQMGQLEKSVSDTTASIQALADDEASIQADINELAEIMPAWENEAHQTSAAWPAPLQAELAPLSQLTETSAPDVWLSRIPAWIDRLQQADAFNRRVTVHYGLDSFPDGKSWEVSEIYYGLGGGFWMTRDGARAGWLEPSPQGWQRREAAELGPLTADMIAIAERRRPSTYLETPIATNE